MITIDAVFNANTKTWETKGSIVTHEIPLGWIHNPVTGERMRTKGAKAEELLKQGWQQGRGKK